MDNRVFQVGAKAIPPAPPAAPSNGYPTNGDPVALLPATQPGEFWFHQIGEELRSIVVAAGLAPSTANTAQVLEAIQRLIDAQSGNYALDTGTANAYVVALNPTIAAYTEGLSIRVKAINANTGASTLNAGGGVVALVNDVGGALASGDIPAGVVFSATYITANNHFRILSQVQSQDDARYAKLGGNALQDFMANLLSAVNILATGSLKSSSPISGIGFAAGAGGSVIQLTNKSTGVLLNKKSGKITMNAAALAAGASVVFQCSNSTILSGDVVLCSIDVATVSTAYTVSSLTTNNACYFIVTNVVFFGTLAEAVIINFGVFSSVNI